MSRSLPGGAIRVMFTEVSFPGVPGACAGARLRGDKASPALTDLRVDGSWVSPSSGTFSDAAKTRRWSGAG
jgi:hypothetical protein